MQVAVQLYVLEQRFAGGGVQVIQHHVAPLELGTAGTNGRHTAGLGG